jgi:hypothetical protein
MHSPLLFMRIRSLGRARVTLGEEGEAAYAAAQPRREIVLQPGQLRLGRRALDRFERLDRVRVVKRCPRRAHPQAEPPDEHCGDDHRGDDGSNEPLVHTLTPARAGDSRPPLTREHRAERGQDREDERSPTEFLQRLAAAQHRLDTLDAAQQVGGRHERR